MVDLDSNPTKLIEIVRDRQADADDARRADDLQHRQRRRQVLRDHPGGVRRDLPGARRAQRHGPALADERHPVGGDLQRADHRRADPARAARRALPARAGARRCCAATCSSTASAACCCPFPASSSSTSRSTALGVRLKESTPCSHCFAPRSSLLARCSPCSPASSTRSPSPASRRRSSPRRPTAASIATTGPRRRLGAHRPAVRRARGYFWGRPSATAPVPVQRRARSTRLEPRARRTRRSHEAVPARIAALRGGRSRQRRPAGPGRSRHRLGQRPRSAHLARPPRCYQVGAGGARHAASPRRACARSSTRHVEGRTPRGARRAARQRAAAEPRARRARRAEARTPAVVPGHERARPAPIPTRCSRRRAGRGGARAARQAEDLLRLRARASARPTRCCRSRATCVAEQQASTSSSGCVETHGRDETAALLLGLEHPAARARSSTAARTLEEFDLDAALARQPERAARRRAGAHQRPGLAPRQALAGRRGAARRRHRRLHDAQRPARREPERRRRADHRRPGARDRARLGARPRRRDRAGRHRRPRSCCSACARARSTSPTQAERAAEHFFRRGNLLALRELALRRTAAARRRGRAGVSRASTASPATWPAGERILVCVGAGAELRRAWSAPARAWPPACAAPWVAAYVETQRRSSR